MNTTIWVKQPKGINNFLNGHTMLEYLLQKNEVSKEFIEALKKETSLLAKEENLTFEGVVERIKEYSDTLFFECNYGEEDTDFSDFLKSCPIGTYINANGLIYEPSDYPDALAYYIASECNFIVYQKNIRECGICIDCIPVERGREIEVVKYLRKNHII